MSSDLSHCLKAAEGKQRTPHVSCLTRIFYHESERNADFSCANGAIQHHRTIRFSIELIDVRVSCLAASF